MAHRLTVAPDSCQSAIAVERQSQALRFCGPLGPAPKCLSTAAKKVDAVAFSYRRSPIDSNLLECTGLLSCLTRVLLIMRNVA
jgi:hypothetical protein